MPAKAARVEFIDLAASLNHKPRFPPPGLLSGEKIYDG
jgi:hypothetical protein